MSSRLKDLRLTTMLNRGKKPVVQFSCEEEAEFRRALDSIPPPSPPDGGWGFMVILGAFLINFIVDGVCFSFGVFLPHLQIGESCRWLIVLIGALLVGCCHLSGPFTSALANRYGCRRVAIGGSVVACAGFIGAATTPNMLSLALTYGVIAGFGFGMMYLPSILCVGLYFERHRALATAAAVCGSGMGTLVLAPAGSWLLEYYDWRGVVIFVGGLALNGTVAGFLFRPLDKDLQRRRKVVLRKMEADKRMGPLTCLIMRRLLLDKNRQRTLSTGSLNNACITFDNRLVRSDELKAEMLVARQQWVKLQQIQEQQRHIAWHRAQQQQMRKRTHSTSLLDRVFGSNGNRCSSGPNAVRVLPTASTFCATPETARREPAAAALQAAKPQQPLRPSALRQIKSVGGRLCEQSVNAGASVAMPSGFNIFMRDSFRSLLAGRLLPRNASNSASNVRLSRLLQQPTVSSLLDGAPSSSDPEEQQSEGAVVAAATDDDDDGLGIVNPVASLTDGDLVETSTTTEMEPIAAPQPVIIAIPDDPDEESTPVVELDSEGRLLSSSADQSSLEPAGQLPSVGGCEQVQPGCSSSFSSSALPLLQLPSPCVDGEEDIPDSPAVLLAVNQMKKQLQKLDAPMYRQDIFYSGSVANLPQYRAAADVDSYVKAITNVPPSSEFRRSGSVRSSSPSIAAASSTVSAVAEATVAEDARSEYSEPARGLLSRAFERFVSWLPATFVDVVSTTLDFRTLRSPTFLLFMTSTVLTMLGFFAPFAFLMDAAVEAGVDEKLAPYLVSVLGVSNTVGRMIAGSLATRTWVDCLIVNDVVLIVAGGMTLIVPLCASFYMFAVYAAVYGMCIATFVSLRSVIVVELMGLEKLTSAFSQLIIFQGIAVIVGTPAIGYLRDVTGDYVLTFYSAGTAIVVSGLLCLPLRCVANWEHRRASRSSHVASSVSRERLRIESTSASTFGEEMVLGQSAATTITTDIAGSIKGQCP